MYYTIHQIPHPLTAGQEKQLARRLLGDLLAKYYNIKHLPEIELTDDGKPFLPSHPDIHFSLSHCPKAVMAVVDANPVGCDIEVIQRDFSSELLEIAFSTDEKNAIIESENPALTLTSLWTRKEACVKRSGIIPDNPADWPSDSPRLFTRLLPEADFAFSIALTP